jgi:WhiB family redox-sensing transcriptional regulator
VRVPTDWERRAACKDTDTDLFFTGPDMKFEEGQESRAKRVCGSCIVRKDCLVAALAHGEKYGIRGGLTPKERKRFLRRGLEAA